MQVPEEVFPVVYLDGAYMPAHEARIGALDLGFLVGDGIFETIHVYRGVPLGLTPHLRRLERSLGFVDLGLPGGVGRLEGVIAGVLGRNGLAGEDAVEAALRITVSRGAVPSGEPTVLVHGRRVSKGHLSKRRLGVELHLLALPGRGGPVLAEHKTLSHLASSLGQLRLLRAGAGERAEGLFTSVDGEVLEGTATNVFLVAGKALVTPPVDSGLLRGLSRQIVLDLAGSLGLTATETRVDVARLRAADEVFVTSSILHVAPAVSLDGVPLGGGGLGPTVSALQQAYADLVTGEIAAWRRP